MACASDKNLSEQIVEIRSPGIEEWKEHSNFNFHAPPLTALGLHQLVRDSHLDGGTLTKVATIVKAFRGE